jgi:hypothetical protein
MRRSVTLFALLAAFSVLALAESWQGRLIDATCYTQKKSEATCDPTGSTTAFGLMVSNKVLALDEAGNTKTAEALKSRADRSTDPNKPPSTMVMAKITGTKEDENTPLKVETIEIQ